MNTKESVVTKTTNSKKGILAGLIVAFAAILCAMVLSITAFAGEAGDSVFATLGNQLIQPIFAGDNEAASYQYGSQIISDSSGGEVENENATIRSVTVHFTNNYDVDAARKEIANPQTLFYEDGKSFNFEVALSEAAIGAPRKITLDEDLDLSYVISNDNNHILFTSENGINKDTDIDLAYGNEVTTYNIKYFYQGPTGEWRDDSTDASYTGEVYSKIPTQADIDAGFPETGGFSLDTYDVGVALPGGIGYASVYYARDVNTVVFDDNGGVNGPGTFYERSEFKVDIAGKNPTRAGYTFDGWYKQLEGGGEEYLNPSTYASGYTMPFDKTTTYKAHWAMKNQDSKYITVVYWGQKAEVSNTFDTADYEYISEAYFHQAYGTKFEVTTDDQLVPKTGGSRTTNPTVVAKFDADYDGTADTDMSKCFAMSFNPSDTDLIPVVQEAVTVQDDDYTLYNVYLKRVKYSWDFYDTSRARNILYTITARWGQDILDQYKLANKAAYDSEDGMWTVKDTGKGQALLLHMSLVNRNKDSNNFYYEIDWDKKATIEYYVQNVGAGTDHSEDTSNYSLYISAPLDGTSFTNEEWVNIDGFITPDKTSGADAPRNGSSISRGSTYKFFYKRSEASLSLYMANNGSSSQTANDAINISNVDYETCLGDIVIPNGTPGTFKGDGSHTLRNFVPENPNFEHLDSNYVFDGWALNNNPDSEKIDLDSQFMPIGNYWLYAKWVAPKEKVTFTQVTVPKTETVASTEVLDNQTYNQKLTGTIPTATEFNNFYFQYWYYYEDDAAKEEGQRTYFDPLNSPVPAHDIVLYPEYSSTEPNTEYLVSPVNKPTEFHGSIEPDQLFYVKSEEAFTKADAEALTIKEWDFDEQTFVDHTIIPTPDEGFEFEKWQLTYGGADLYNDINVGTKVQGACGVKAVFKSTVQPQAAVATPPSPIPGLQYTGKEQDIATDGVATNGTMQYIVDQNSQSPTIDEGEWSDTIDKKTAVGIYYVHYYAKGNEGFLDSATGTIQCQIAEAELPDHITIHVEGVTIIKPYIGQKYPDIVGPECFNATCDWAGFNKENVKAIGESDKEIYINGCSHGERYSGWFSQYRWHYEDDRFSADQVTFEMDGDDYSVLVVGEPVPELTPPTKVNDFLYDGEFHNSFATAGEMYDPEGEFEDCVMVYQYTTDPDAPTSSYGWTDSIDDAKVKIRDVGIYYLWYSIANVKKLDQAYLIMNPATIGAVRIYEEGQPIAVPTWIDGSIKYDARDEKPYNPDNETYWNGYNSEIMTIGYAKEEWVPGEYDATFTLPEDSVYTWEGYDASVRTVPAKWYIDKMDYTIYVYGNDVYKQYDGNRVTLEGADCVNFYCADFPEGIDPAKFIIDPTLEVSGEQVGIYSTAYKLDEYYYQYVGQYKDFVDVTFENAAPDKTTLHISDFQYVDKPVWTEDITYDEAEHNVSIKPDVDNWDNFNTDAMEIGGTIKGTDVGAYTATFTLKEGYAWKNQDPNVRTADVQWNIVDEPQPVAIPVPTWNEDIVYDGQNHDVKYGDDVDHWTNYDENKMEMDGQTMSNDPGTFTAEFTVNDGFVWEGKDPTLKTVNVEWKIVPAVVEKPTFKESLPYTGSQYSVNSTDYWNNFNELYMYIEPVYEATDPGTYSAKFALTRSGYLWKDESAETREISVNWSIVATEVAVPTWKADITYDGKSHNVSTTDYWNNFNTTAMTIGGEVEGTEAKEYTATFTLNDGYVFAGKEISTRSVDATWKIVASEPVVTPPTKGDDYWYDTYEHLVFSDGGSINAGHTLEYNYSYDWQGEEPPQSDWTGDWQELKVQHDGTMYLWYRVDGGDAIMLRDGQGQPQVLRGYAIGAYVKEDGTLTIKGEIDRDDMSFIGTIPRGYEIASAEDFEDILPWSGGMGEIKHVYIESSISTWLEPYNGNKAYMTNWFNGATSLIDINADESLFYNQDGTCKVEGTDVFVNTNNLIGGNGTTFAKKKDTGLTYLYNDYATDTTGTKHEGYLTPITNTLNIKYNYNGGEGTPENPLTNQKVAKTNFFTVTGFNNTFAAKAPVKEGYDFAGWTYNETTYKSDANISASIGASANEITLTAKWESQVEKKDNPFTFNPAQPWVLVNDSILVKLENVGDNPTISWDKVSGDNIEFEVVLGKMAVINGLEASETDAVISVTTSETENYKETTKTCPVKVTAKEEQNVDVTVTEGLYVDEFGMIQVTGIQEKPDMTWEHESGEEAIEFVSVTSTYIVNFQGIAGGTETVKLVLAETEHFAETVIYVDVTILPKVVDELSFAKDSYEVSTGGYIDITVDGLSAERTNYSWEIVEGDGKIALSYTKNNPVRVNGLAQGTAKIKITAQASIKYTEVSAETTIEVSGKPKQNVTLDKNELNLMLFQSDSVKASGMLENPTITWSIEDEEIATITSATDDNDVTVKGLAIGETKLILELGETTTYAKTTKEVTVNVTDSDTYYLAERGVDYRGIMEDYNAAASVRFSPQDNTKYSDEYLNVDIDHTGLIKAYKVRLPEYKTYSIVVASPGKIAFSGMTGASLFRGWNYLLTVDFDGVIFDNARSFVRMFNSCNALKTISVEETGIKTSSVTDFRYMFAGCEELTNITLGSSFIVKPEADISNMFESCTKLDAIFVEPGTDWTQGTGPSTDMFANCPKLISQTDAVDRTKAYIGAAFTLRGLEVKYLLNRTGYVSILDTYKEATSIVFSPLDSKTYSDEYINVAIETDAILAYKVPDTDDSYHVVVSSPYNIGFSEHTGDSLFAGFAKLTSVDFGEIKFDKAESFIRTFNYCTSLKTIDINWTNLNTSKVNDYRFMFAGCSNLEQITLGDKFIVSDEADVSNMFRECLNLMSIVVPVGTDWSKGTGSGDEMFFGCSKLVPFGDGIDREKAYVGPGGYFVDGTAQEVAYLVNRPTTNLSIFYKLTGATSFEFKVNDSTAYSSEFIDVATDGRSIRAYKVKDGDNSYHVVVTTGCKKIATSASSCAAMFWGFSNLRSVDFGDVDFTNSTSFVRMFNGCSSLQSINVNWSGLVTTNVNDYRFMFSECSALTSIDLSNKFIVRDDALLTNMFAGCSNLKNIYAPSGTDWSKGSGDGTDMFAGCSKLVPSGGAVDRSKAFVGSDGYFTDSTPVEVAWLNNRPSSNASIFEAYKGATSFEFKVEDSTEYSSDYINVATDGRSITAYRINDNDGSYHVIVASPCKSIKTSSTSCAAMFWGFSNLTSVNFGSVDFTESTSFIRMFNSCYKLQSININWTGLVTSNVTDYRNMFYDCASLTSITLSNKFVVRDDAILTNMFTGCSKLESIIVPSGTDWSKGTGDGTDMFAGCSKLVPSGGAVDRSKAFVGSGGYFTDGSTPTVAYLANRPSNNYSIIDAYKAATSVVFKVNDSTPYSSDYINVATDGRSIKAYKITDSDGSYHVVIASPCTTIKTSSTSCAAMFWGFSNLVSVDFGSLDFTGTTSFIRMFNSCSKLQIIDANWTGLNTSAITDYRNMFYDCGALTKITLGAKFIVRDDANLSNMFTNCSSLTTIVVPDGTDWSKGTGASTDMFLGCSKIVPSGGAVDRTKAFKGEGGYFS